MSPILDLQQRLQEVGRIRMGAQVPTAGGRSRPSKLEAWRLTSRDEVRLAAVAGIYGGEVRPWEGREGEYEVFTQADALRVLIIPGQALSQWWELWSGGGCTRRCDGKREMLSDGPCLCPAAYDERTEASSKGKACKPTTRLAVLLPDVPGIGHWRLETHSYYAAVELAAAANLIEEATRRGSLLPARLRIDVRRKVAGGKTTTYPVPVIDVDVSAGQLLALGAGAAEGEILDVPQLPPGTSGSTAIGIAERYVPVPPPVEHAAPSVSEGLAQVAEPPPAAVPQANAAAPLGPQVPPPGSSPLVVDEDEGELVPEAPPVVPAAAPPAPPAPAPVPPPAPATPDAGEMLAEAMANNAQRRLLWATVRGRGITEEQLRGILQDVTGQESTAHIPARLFDAVVTAVQGAPAPTQEAT